jgi:hypothetical protein
LDPDVSISRTGGQSARVFTDAELRSIKNPLDALALFEEKGISTDDGVTLSAPDRTRNVSGKTKPTTSNVPPSLESTLIVLRAEKSLDSARALVRTVVIKHALFIGADKVRRTEWREALMSGSRMERFMMAGEFDRLCKLTKTAGSNTSISSIVVTEDESSCWTYVSPSVGPAYVTRLTPEPSEGEITQITGEIFLSDGRKKMLCFPIESLSFYEGGVVTFVKAVVVDKPMSVETLEDTYLVKPRVYVYSRNISKPFSVDKPGYLLLIDNDVRVDFLIREYSIDDNRALQLKPDSLGYQVTNDRPKNLQSAFVNMTDTYKTRGQTLWTSSTMLGRDVAGSNLGKMATLIQTMAKANPDLRSLVSGYGPIRLDNESVVYVGNGSSFDVKTGKPVVEYMGDLKTKPSLAQFGISTPNVDTLTNDYRTLLQILDAVPSIPGIPAAQLGVALLAGLGTLNRNYRTIVFNYGRRGSGKTKLSKVILSMQSPNARTYGTILPTATMRTARGGTTTTNGVLMDLQYCGGWFPVLDDYAQEISDDMQRQMRAEGLSVLVGALEGAAPSKMNWGKAGPEFARAFQPQTSFAINAEIPLLTSNDSTLRRIIWTHGPDDDYNSDKGYSNKIIDALLSDDSTVYGDQCHNAWSDFIRWSFVNEKIINAQYRIAVDKVESWADTIDDGSVRRVYAIAVTGLLALQKRCSEVGIPDVKVAKKIQLGIEGLHDLAAIQSEFMNDKNADVKAIILRLIRNMLNDPECDTSIPGPPVYDVIDDSMNQEWTQPGIPEADDDHDDLEVSPDNTFPTFIESPVSLGMVMRGDWNPRKNIVGYLKMPSVDPHSHAKFKYRIEIPASKWPLFVKSLNRQSKIEKLGIVFTDSIVRAELLSDENIAYKGRSGTKRSPAKYHAIFINAETVFSTEEN